MKVKLTITKTDCRCNYYKEGESFIVEDFCPPICHELWNNIYPQVYVLLNKGSLDYKETKANCFDAFCPDEQRVQIHGELIED